VILSKVQLQETSEKFKNQMNFFRLMVNLEPT